jgi:uncharacterized membrane protein YraQ (UPF0718 family)
LAHPEGGSRAQRRRRMPLIVAVTALVVLALALIWAVGSGQPSIDDAFTVPVSVADRLHTFTTIFLGIFIEAVPFLLLGTLASGVVEVFVRPETLTRWIPRHPLLAVLAGAGLGIVLPVCECGIVVVVRRLLAKGLPLRVGVAFLLAAPVVNPIVFASTLTAFGAGGMLLARFVLSFAIATLIALLFGTARPDQVLREGPGHGHDHHHHEEAPTAEPLARRVVAAIGAGADDLFDVGRYLVAGSLLAAALQALVPQEAILGVGSGAVSSVLVLSLLAFVISVCSTVDAFVALSFVGTFTPASILAFLVFGPMVDIKSSLMFSSIFQPRVVAYLIALPLGATLVATLLLATQVGF